MANRSLIMLVVFSSDFLAVNPGGENRFSCKQDVEEATSSFLNCFADIYQRLAVGLQAWDNIILTDGGSALLHQKPVSFG